MARLDVQVLVYTRSVCPFEIQVDSGIELLPDFNDGLGAKGNR